MFRSIQTFSVTGKFTERYHIFCAQIDLLFTIFVCSHYRPWATIRLVHHFGCFVMCINSRLNCTHFSCHWRKLRNVSRRLMQISKRQRDPCYKFKNLHRCFQFSDLCSLAHVMLLRAKPMLVQPLVTTDSTYHGGCGEKLNVVNTNSNIVIIALLKQSCQEFWPTQWHLAAHSSPWVFGS